MAVGKTSRLKIIFCLATIYLAGHTAYVIGEPFYRHGVFKSQMTQVSLFTELKMEALREMVEKEIEKTGVPIAVDNVIIQRNNIGDIAIRTSWTEDVYFMDYYLMTHKFDINVGGAAR
jgi:hypothetical protein